jgi:hypothetical protein
MTSQTKIDFFYKSDTNNKKYQLKRYFYLIWEDVYRPNVSAYWLENKPEKINFIELVHCNYIKKGYYFYLCGWFRNHDDKEYVLMKEKMYKNIHYLKSHLQKSIRNQDDLLAIPTCYHLMKLDICELLRRLPIIMLEDLFLHESMSTIIWFMVAKSSCPTFKFKKYMYEWLLGTIFVMCKIDDFDLFEAESTVEENEVSIEEKINIYQLLDKYNDLDVNEYSLLYSLHIRIAYGGMKGDMTMIKLFINLWEKRFRSGNMKINTMKVRPISLYITDLELADWNLSAIDFHCNPRFLEFIQKKYNDLSIDDIKKIVWYNSSSINKRCIDKQEKYMVSKWLEIKDFVIKTQKYLLEAGY